MFIEILAMKVVYMLMGERNPSWEDNLFYLSNIVANDLSRVKMRKIPFYMKLRDAQTERVV